MKKIIFIFIAMLTTFTNITLMAQNKISLCHVMIGAFRRHGRFEQAERGGRDGGSCT